MDENEAKFVNKMLRTRNAEALEWLLAETPASLRNLGELPTASAVALVRKIYETGAAKVLVVKIGDGARGEHSNWILIELPVDPEARQRLFQLDAKMAESEGFDGNVDEGQQYLFGKVKAVEVIDAVFGHGGTSAS